MWLQKKSAKSLQKQNVYIFKKASLFVPKDLPKKLIFVRDKLYPNDLKD